MIRTTISAIIPTHDRADSLAQAVASVHAQSVPVDEIVIVDNGSTPPVDPAQFAGSASSLVVVRNENAVGAAAARNIGVANATGDFVAFLDDDDTWAPDKIAFVSACVAQNPNTDVVIHRTGYHIPPQPAAKGCSQVTDPLLRMIRSQPPHLDGVTVRTAHHLEDPFDESMTAAEDLDYLIRLAKIGAVFAESRTVLALHSVGGASVITVDDRIAGRMSLLGRHPEILADRRARSFFYMRLGHLHRRGGQRWSAARSFGTAIRADPRSPYPWKGLARVAIGR